MSKSRIIISDPHGCYKTLMALIAQLPEGIPLTFAGDLVDRGKDSRKIIEFVKNNGHDCVLGNHEVMMLTELAFQQIKNAPLGEETYRINTYASIWLPNGGDKCLESYAFYKEETLESGEVIKLKRYDTEALKEHMAWLKTLPYHILYDDIVDGNGRKLLVTHTTAAHVWGQLSPENPAFIDSVTWERDENPPAIEGIYNVYGHTPQYSGATIEKDYACIDGGAYYNRSGYGKMFALEFPSLRLYTQDNIE